MATAPHQRGGDGEYGTVFLALTTSGGATPQDGLAVDWMPVADSKGGLNYERTFSAEIVPDGLLKHLSHCTSCSTGIDANNNDKYDVDALGVSTFAKSLGSARRTGGGNQPGQLRRRTGRRHGGTGRAAVSRPAAPQGSDLNAPLAAAGLLLLLGRSFGVSAATHSLSATTVADDRRKPA